jgi:poly-gamma-glutamate synthesis protein (capsule biosynthesis protein)
MLVAAAALSLAACGETAFAPLERFHKKTPPPREITLLFGGDVMLSRAIGRIIERRGPEYPFSLIASTTREAGFFMANLENPVSSRGTDQGSIYSFRATPESMTGLVYAGVDFVALANNHIGDWGDEALIDTQRHLNDYGIAHAGIGLTRDAALAPARVVRDGVAICVVSTTEFAGWRGRTDASPAVAPLDASAIVAALDDPACDIRIATLHWGNEYETNASSEQRTFAAALVDAGVDFIIGHHPHVLQEVEQDGDSLIAYSLGNLVFDQNFSPDTRRSALLQATWREGEGVTSWSMAPVRFTDDFRPYVVTLEE